jgi:hypothetical protein
MPYIGGNMPGMCGGGGIMNPPDICGAYPGAPPLYPPENEQAKGG